MDKNNTKKTENIKIKKLEKQIKLLIRKHKNIVFNRKIQKCFSNFIKK